MPKSAALRSQASKELDLAAIPASLHLADTLNKACWLLGRLVSSAGVRVFACSSTLGILLTQESTGCSSGEDLCSICSAGARGCWWISPGAHCCVLLPRFPPALLCGLSHALCPSVSAHPEAGLQELLFLLIHWHEDKNLITHPLLHFSNRTVHEMVVQPWALTDALHLTAQTAMPAVCHSEYPVEGSCLFCPGFAVIFALLFYYISKNSAES